MKATETKRQVLFEDIKKNLRHYGVWTLLVVSLLLMVTTANDPFLGGFEFLSPILNHSQTGNSFWFALGSGLFISSVFTLFIVVLPKKRRKQKTKKTLLHIPSFILEGEEGGFFTWSKNIIFCDPDKCTLDNVLDYKEKVLKNKFTQAQIKITLDHSSEALHLFENALPAAMSISSAHGLFWMGMTSSIKKFSDIPASYNFSDNKDWEEITQLYSLYGYEFIKSLESFVRLKT